MENECPQKFVDKSDRFKKILNEEIKRGANETAH